MGRYVIGIDGGGTAAKGLTVSETGEILCRFQGGTTNYNGAVKAQVDRNMRELLRSAQGSCSAADCQAICIGSAGVNNSVAAAFLRQAVREAGFTCPLQIVADSVTAHAGALDGNAGIVLIAGTGSICFAQRETGEQLQIGGNGHLIDDGGSGYDLSIQILRAVVKAQDGRAPATILQDLVLEHLKLADVSFLIDWLYDEKRTKKEIAALAVLLDRALQHQDQAAQKIVQNAAASLAELALPAISFLNGRAALALSGSVLKKNAAVRDSLIHCLRERYPEEDQLVLISPKHEADYGAVLLAKRLAHRNIP